MFHLNWNHIVLKAAKDYDKFSCKIENHRLPINTFKIRPILPINKPKMFLYFDRFNCWQTSEYLSKNYFASLPSKLLFWY